jgi:hypothetical protein
VSEKKFKDAQGNPIHVPRHDIEKLVLNSDMPDPGKVNVDLTTRNPSFTCSSCDAPFYWVQSHWVCEFCEYSFGVVGGVQLLQHHIDRLQAVQFALAEIASGEPSGEEEVEESKPEKRGGLRRFFKKGGSS